MNQREEDPYIIGMNKIDPEIPDALDVSGYVIANGAERITNADELRNIAYKLNHLADCIDINKRSECGIGDVKVKEDIAGIASKLYSDRRKREKLLGDFLGEPAWDILLDLYIHHEKGRTISTTSCCIAACVPHTTALRWISQLTKYGFVQTYRSETDHRYTMVGLTRKGVETMQKILIAHLPQ